MKRYLLPHGKNFYKANLHCHSTVSDGKFSPEELKKLYMEQGYSIIAYTDHEILLPHNDLSDDSFLALNGYEYELIEDETDEKNQNRLRKATHLCLIALEPNTTRHICWHGKIWGNAPRFCVTLNHPAWSMEDMADIANYHGMNALEIYNTNAAIRGWEAYCPYIYESMVRRGKRIGCVAADDCHRSEQFFGGWTMICADDLNYRTITQAMERGDYYASTGPEIKELWYEDGRIYVTCSPAATIKANYGSRYAELHQATTSTSFPVNKDHIFIRITVTDASGKCANTRAYFVDEFQNDNP